MFRKPSKTKNLRKRPSDSQELDNEDDEEEGSAVVQTSKPTRRGLEGKLEFSSGAGGHIRKLRRGEESRGAGEAEDLEGGGEGRLGPELKTTFAYESERLVQTSTDSKATATNETETEFDRDSRAIREKVLKQAEEALRGDGSGARGEGKVYKGQAGYVDHTAGFRREHTVANEKASGAFGPLRASTNIRMTVRFDYQPDICKDYKETGYCGYGDSCKFMHDRGDYKSGWQIDREWEEKEKKRKQRVAMGLGEEEEEGEAAEADADEKDELPFACFICRQPFVDPVVTRCKHYFCEHCALKHNVKNRNCYVCNKPTGGIFNMAHEIIRKTRSIGGDG